MALAPCFLDILCKRFYKAYLEKFVTILHMCILFTSFTSKINTFRVNNCLSVCLFLFKTFDNFLWGSHPKTSDVCAELKA